MAELGQGMQGGTLSPTEVTQAFLARIDALEPKVNAFITRTSDAALAAAQQADDAINGGRHKSPLHGIPVALKDLFWSAGVTTTSGSVIDAEFVPSRDAEVVRRLLDAGAHSVGKTNMCEFAFDTTGRNAHYGPPHNPWGLEHMAGGSSSGSAAAVAAGMAAIALGTDTGGSIRIPSALCGLTGLKPTFGLVSRSGVTPLSWTLDTVGPMARSALDAALAMNVLAGHDTTDPYSADVPPQEFTADLDAGVRGLRIGVPKEFVWEVMDPEVEAAFKVAMDQFRSLGAAVEEVSVPELEWAPLIFTALTPAEAVVLHRDRLRTDAERYDPAVRRRLETGFFISAPTYLQAQRVRELFGRKLSAVYQRADLIAMPTVPVPAPVIGEAAVTVNGTEVPVRDTLARLTRIFNINGLPAISAPCGFTDAGLPIGLQLAGRPFEDALVLRAAHAYQGVTRWHAARPAL